MKSISISLIVCMLLYPLIGFGQQTNGIDDGDDLFQARSIKINRMSVEWKHEPMDLILQNGIRYSGKFIALQNNIFRLQSNGQVREVPLMDVKTIVLKRKPQDLLLVGLSAVGIAALFAGGASLGFDSSDQMVVGAAGIGAVVGVAIGWRAFYQNIEIPIK